MINAKKLVEVARKWQKLASRGKRRISDCSAESGSPRAAAIAEKGRFAAYTADGKRFMVPLSYLHRPVFQELLNMAEEEFGLSIDGALRFPCDAELVDCAMSLASRDVPSEVEKAFMASLRSSSSTKCLSSPALSQAHPYQQLALHGL